MAAATSARLRVSAAARSRGAARSADRVSSRNRWRPARPSRERSSPSDSQVRRRISSRGADGDAAVRCCGSVRGGRRLRHPRPWLPRPERRRRAPPAASCWPGGWRRARRSPPPRPPRTGRAGVERRVQVRGDSAHHVVRGRRDGHGLAGEVDAVARAGGHDAREPRADTLGRQVPQVERHRAAALPVLAEDRARHLVARGQLLREPLACAVQEVCPLPPHRFRHQEPRRARDRERRGMELHELHVEQRGAGAEPHGHAVAGRHGRVGGLGEHLPRAASGQQRRPRQHQGLAAVLVQEAAARPRGRRGSPGRSSTRTSAPRSPPCGAPSRAARAPSPSRWRLPERAGRGCGSARPRA